MAKQTITFTIDIDDTNEVDLLQNLDVLRSNERLSEFCCQAIRKAMEDRSLLDTINKKIAFNGKGTLMDRQVYFDFINKKIAYLESQLNALRYDMHTAAVLADKVQYKELSVEILSTLDTLFEGVKNSVQLYPGDYIDAMRWKKRETELQESFSKSLSNFRLLENALFSLDEPVKETSANMTNHEGSSATVHPTENEQNPTTELFEQLLNGINDIKEVLRGSSILDAQAIVHNMNNAGRVINGEVGEATPIPQTKEPQPTGTIPTAPVVYDAVPETLDVDLGALADFFGGM